tara:strand:- start:392 stop:718 length:327 start_codon:yes stop_codon:yes gene_type:complete
MTCKVYSKAETAARDAVIQALYDNVDKETLDQLWGHYLGLRTIHEEHTHSDTVTVPEGTDVYDNLIQFPTQTNIDLDLGAADTITFTPDEHLNDVITFSDDIDPDKGA